MLAPLTVLAVVFVRTDDVTDIIRSVVSVLVTAGFHLIVKRLVRDRGNLIQQSLWASWGGSTTVQRLRWRDHRDTEISRLHHRVQAMTGIPLPTRAAEETSPVGADHDYSDAIARLREQTRDHDLYPRVWSELKQYGTARNLYGVKPAGLGVATAALTVSVALVVARLTTKWQVAWWATATVGVVALLAIFVWCAVVTPAYVRTASERYSDALLAAAEDPEMGASRHS